MHVLVPCVLTVGAFDLPLKITQCAHFCIYPIASPLEVEYLFVLPCKYTAQPQLALEPKQSGFPPVRPL